TSGLVTKNSLRMRVKASSTLCSPRRLIASVAIRNMSPPSFKLMSFAGIRIVTLAEGEISELHIGLKGTMNALFLKDLDDKTRGGLRGRVELGRSGGGLCYGYTIVENGERGGREILQAEAAVVRRIFADFAAGKSPRRIAAELNRGGTPGPGGR